MRRTTGRRAAEPELRVGALAGRAEDRVGARVGVRAAEPDERGGDRRVVPDEEDDRAGARRTLEPEDDRVGALRTVEPEDRLGALLTADPDEDRVGELRTVEPEDDRVGELRTAEPEPGRVVGRRSRIGRLERSLRGDSRVADGEVRLVEGVIGVDEGLRVFGSYRRVVGVAERGAAPERGSAEPTAPPPRRRASSVAVGRPRGWSPDMDGRRVAGRLTGGTVPPLPIPLPERRCAGFPGIPGRSCTVGRVRTIGVHGSPTARSLKT